MSTDDIFLCETGLAVDAVSNAAPEWVQLAPIGDVVARDGRKFVLDEPQLVIETFNAHGADLPIDYQHQNNKPSQGPIPAAGWISEMATRDGYLWGRVKWTERAKGMIAAREYRYLSPVLQCLKNRRVIAVTGAGLVHSPALHLTALAEEDNSMRDLELMMQRLAEVLGLDPEADLETLIEAIEALKGDGDESSKRPVDPKKYALVEALAEVLSVNRAQGEQMRKNRAEAKVKAAGDAGYLGGQAMQKWALELCMNDEASFDTFISTTPAMFAHLLPTHPRPSAPNFQTSEELFESDAEAEICAQLGLEPGRLSN